MQFNSLCDSMYAAHPQRLAMMCMQQQHCLYITPVPRQGGRWQSGMCHEHMRVCVLHMRPIIAILVLPSMRCHERMPTCIWEGARLACPTQLDDLCKHGSHSVRILSRSRAWQSEQLHPDASRRGLCTECF